MINKTTGFIAIHSIPFANYVAHFIPFHQIAKIGDGSTFGSGSEVACNTKDVGPLLRAQGKTFGLSI